MSNEKIEPGILVRNKSDLRIDISETRSDVTSGKGDMIAFGIPAGTTGIVLEPEMAPMSVALPAIGIMQVGWRVKFTTHCGPFVLELERVLQDHDLSVVAVKETYKDA